MIHSAGDIFNKHATEYQSRFMNVDLYADTFADFCASLQTGAKVLEIACGPGNITQHLLRKRPDLQIFGIDLAPNMIELARQNNPSAEFAVMDCRNIATLDSIYDAVMCGFCLPYISMEEAERLIADCTELLSPNGVIYLSTMEDDYSKSGIVTNSHGEQCQMYFYTSGDLRQMLVSHNFEVLCEERKISGAVTDLVLIARKRM